MSATDGGTLRRAMSRFATGVTVLTTVHDGVPLAMTANSLTSVSLDPPLVLTCVEQDSRFHDAVLASRVWGVSILPASARPLAEWLATPGRPRHQQLERVPHHVGAALGVPLIDGAAAALELQTYAVYPGGDHSIVVGNVHGLEVPDVTGPALVFHRGQFGTLP